MRLNDRTAIERSFTRQDLEQYARLSGHVGSGEEVPEPLVGALFSYLLGMKIPGPGTMYLKQDTEFQQPARVEELLTAEVRITGFRTEKNLVDLDTTCKGEDGRTIASGRALVYLENLAARCEAND